ncbi:phosphorylase superfamily protein [Novosphingobium sp. PhB165]|uniref:phosphorylase family protein n=1 Tax=Novosphingobium sp. PhB165 TaxID=2485105 RepID=UPI001051119C|nr:phosphorylase [Novosphingobium sp. PhB165]TCM16060.1 phosphorylase superfamily protein [Novosphingobium sp. PhB165]
MTLLIACGLKREARLFDLPGRNVFVVAGGGDSARLERELDDLAETHPGIILSCGIAGALSRALRSGDLIVDGDSTLVDRLRQDLPHAISGAICGSDTIVATAAGKRDLARQSGAIAADMESHIARRVAMRRQLPFAAIRVIADCAEDDLPPAALVGMRPDGGLALGAVLLSLARRPGQLPALLHTGRQTDQALRRLSDAFDTLIRAGFDRLDLA